jgi:hypothetical protein
MQVRSFVKQRPRLAGLVRLASVTVMRIASGGGCAGSSRDGRGDIDHAVSNWNRIALTTLVAFAPAASGAPPVLQVNLGMVQGSVYGAINASGARHQPYLLETRFAVTSSKEAAVATAAYRVLSSIVSTVPPSIPFPILEHTCQCM